MRYNQESSEMKRSVNGRLGHAFCVVTIPEIG